MKYEIIYTETAKDDLKGIYRYISDRLVEPKTAKNLVEKIIEEIRSLAEMPQRYRRYEEEPWYSQGLRVLNVKNYLVFYLVDEKMASVTIVRVIYGGRDVKNQLVMDN